MDELTQGNEKKAWFVDMPRNFPQHYSEYISVIRSSVLFLKLGVPKQLIKTGLHGPSGWVFLSKS